MSQQLSIDTLYPWKSKSGLIGYSNQAGQVKIQPQFENAGLFSNQFAIVEKDGHIGVISKDGQLILACQYDGIQLAALGNETLAVTQKKYNAWWKVHKWKLFPGFSILGGNGNKRIFDREVPTAKWEITSLDHKQTFVSSDHRPNDFPYDTGNIRRKGDKILINDQLYQLKNGRIKHISGKYKGFLRDATLLRQDGASFKKVDPDLNPEGDAVFKIPEQVSLNVNQELQVLKTVSRVAGLEQKFDFMEDQHAQIYIFPDLKKPFPSKISAYPDPQSAALDIIKRANMICSVPETDHFLIRSERRFYILHRNGTWETDIAKLNDFIVVSNGGNLMYPSIVDLGLSGSLPKEAEVKWAERTQANKHWYQVSVIIKSDAAPLSGIFDTASKKWVLPMAYSSLEQMDGYPYIWKFEQTYERDYKKRKYGVIDIRTGKIIIAPLYTSLNPDGKARLYDDAGQWNEFYINPLTGQEYSE